MCTYNACIGASVPMLCLVPTDADTVWDGGVISDSVPCMVKEGSVKVGNATSIIVRTDGYYIGVDHELGVLTGWGWEHGHDNSQHLPLYNGERLVFRRRREAETHRKVEVEKMAWVEDQTGTDEPRD